MFREARLAALICVRFVAKLQTTAVSFAWVDALGSGLAFRLNAQDFGVVAYTDFGSCEVDKDFDAERILCRWSWYGGRVVSHYRHEAWVVRLATEAASPNAEVREWTLAPTKLVYFM